jgi:ketosteroid isomerase-like protein
MRAHHFDAAVDALKSALGDRLAPDIDDFVDLFTDGAVIDVPFDANGAAEPVRGRAAIRTMVRQLEPMLRFDEVRFDEVHETREEDVLVCEYEALLTRADLGARLRRRYIAVVRLEAGRIVLLREYGGPFLNTGVGVAPSRG